MTTVYVPDRYESLAEACAHDFGRLAFDGFGIMLSDEQLEARARLGRPGPRANGEFKTNWLSGGQRSGKTVEAALFHFEAGLYKAGLDTVDRRYWSNYQYGTLAIAPTTELSLRLWTIADEISKGVNAAQWDRRARRSRGGAFLGKVKAGKAGEWSIVRFSNGSRIDFRSSEGFAYRLEGGQWWFITWDEWASQPDREIHSVLIDVLLGRARDHDAKLMPMAWPKPETERHLIDVIRGIESRSDLDSQVIYLSAEKAYFTNRKSLSVERRRKSEAEWKRTVLGEPAGGASLVFTQELVGNAHRPSLPFPVKREEGYGYLDSWDFGIAHDSTVGLTWRIPIVDGRRVVTPEHKATIVNATEIPGGDTLTLDQLTFAVAMNHDAYGSVTAVDATGLGGVAAVRDLQGLKGGILAFTSRGNHRIYGNMRLAAITNGLDMLSWGRDTAGDGPWGAIEMPTIQRLLDQLANFDPEAKGIPDDWVWAFLIGLWYIRRYWAVGNPNAHNQRDFDVRGRRPVVTRTKRGTRFVPIDPSTDKDEGVRYIRVAR